MLQGCAGWPSLAQPLTSPAERTAHNLLLLLGVGAPSPVSIGVPAEPSVPGSPQTLPSPYAAASLGKQDQHPQEEERNPLDSGLRSFAGSSLLAASTTSMSHPGGLGLSLASTGTISPDSPLLWPLVSLPKAALWCSAENYPLEKITEHLRIS